MKLYELAEVKWNPSFFYVFNEEGKSLAKKDNNKIKDLPIKNAEVLEIEANNTAVFVTVKEEI